MLDQLVRDWCSRTDTHLTVQPVLDLAGHDQTSVHQIKTRTLLRADLIARTCVFPGAPNPPGPATTTTSSRSTTTTPPPVARRATATSPHCAGTTTSSRPTPGGATPPRDRHRLWSDPHGQQFLRDRAGTTDVTPTNHRRGTGCRHQINRQ
ncbi:hypothetical protein [Nocardioides sp. B-3]|uniref:hypothetical protein n=1 Tax=Nocardioides sp. B-3 TaxID=2895565 RepID=UPI0021523E6F|nr:hypothetical protein [Nocardioides sp. B-3]UUZ58771.1 hypothetical protein LP418_22175 [Nocardioides sp. B-3]